MGVLLHLKKLRGTTAPHYTMKKIKKSIQPELKNSVQSLSASQALENVLAASKERFDASIEIHIHTGIDPRKGDQVIRGSVVLPHGTGAVKKIAVFATGEKADAARAAGADLVGGEELIQEIKQSGKAQFHIAIATPDMMKQMASIAKILGPRGLMPSPKNETVTQNISGAVEAVKKGRVDFKNDDSGNVHQIIGRRSFSHDALLENLNSFLDALKKVRPSAAKGIFIQSATVCSTMGKGVPLLVS